MCPPRTLETAEGPALNRVNWIGNLVPFDVVRLWGVNWLIGTRFTFQNPATRIPNKSPKAATPIYEGCLKVITKLVHHSLDCWPSRLSRGKIVLLYHSQTASFSPLFFHPCIKLSTGQVSIRSGGSKVSSSVSLCIPSRVLAMAAKPDPYEGIDFDEICEATGLAVDEIKCLKVFHISVFRFFWRMKGGWMVLGTLVSGPQDTWWPGSQNLIQSKSDKVCGFCFSVSRNLRTCATTKFYSKSA